MTITWTDEWSVGNDVIDRQHKKLIHLVNLAEQYAESEDPALSEQFHELLHQVSTYAREHFETEENLLQFVGYSDLKAHAEEHNKLWGDMSSYLLAAAQKKLNKKEFAKFLLDWWLEHALQWDMKYKDALK
jgi:hemerythrin